MSEINETTNNGAFYLNNTVEPPRITKYTEMINSFKPYGISCLLYGILFIISLYKGFYGISMPVLCLATIIGLYFIMKKLGIASKKTDWFYMTGIELLGISCFLTGDMTLVFFNVCGIVLLIISFLLSRFCDTSGWGFPKYLKELINGIFVPVSYLDGFFKSLGHYFSKKEEKENSKAKYVWIGVLMGVPFVLIVTALLVSADVVFGNIFKNLFSNIRFPQRPVWLVILILIGIPGTFGLLGYFADEKISGEVKEQRTWEPLIAITFLVFSTVVYLIFSMIQIKYLFIGGFTLPEGYTYATYAREGFYQLLAVCLINLIVLFVCIGKFRENLILKTELTVFSVCTYIMLFSSLLRMVLYVKVYQLTYLRLLTLWGLLVIGIVLIGCLVTIWKNQFPLFPYVMVVVAVLYLALSFARPGYVIAKYNLTDTGKEVQTDYNYIVDLNTDAVSVYLQSPQFDKKQVSEYKEYKIESYRQSADEMGITDFNLSYYRTGRLIRKVYRTEE